MKKIFSKSKKRGYTLVETLVAISIFTVSILGLLVTLSQGLADTGYAKKKIAAAYLAQEGIEYIRNMRDTFMIYNDDPQVGWNEFETYLGDCWEEDGCYFNPDGLNFNNPSQPITDLTIAPCDCPELFYDAASGSYGYAVGQPSGLTRKISIATVNEDDINNIHEIKITSTVSWTQGSGGHSIEFSDNLYNWIE